MGSASRFARASTSLELGVLRGGVRRGLWLSLALAMGMHVSLATMSGVEQELKSAKPLTTQFVKRAPRLTKPLELKKRPRPKTRRMEREMVAVKAKAHSEGPTSLIRASVVVSSLARPGLSVARSLSFGDGGRDPAMLAEAIEGTKETKSRIDMGLEMIDIGELDTGQYHAMVVQDPSDRRNIRGFLHITLITPSRSDYDLNILMRSMRRLATLGMNQFTSIRTDVWPPLTFDSRELFKVPWLHTTEYGEDLTLTDSERNNLGEYLTQGGFLHADGKPPLTGQPYAPPVRLHKMISDALGAKGLTCGRDWSFERLPNDHAIYHCYFDFDGPPPGAGIYKPAYGVAMFMDGVSLEGRLVAITSQMICTHMWGWWGCGAMYSGGTSDPTRALQFGVNLIVFALTQEGSITHRLMESVQ